MNKVYYNQERARSPTDYLNSQEENKMKYEVEMSCGHTETIQLFGKCADRERKIEWLERYGLCEECKKEKAAEEMKKAEEAGLPELEGSEKQIAWAAKIRNGFMPKAKEALEKSHGHPRAKAWYDWFAGQTDASFWIDIRLDSIGMIIAEWKHENPIKKEA